MRAAVLALGLSLLPFGATARAGETTTAAEATAAGHRLERALDALLDASARTSDGPRTLCLLIDATPSLGTAAFADKLDAALARQAPHLAATEIAVGHVGEKEPIVLAPTADRAAVSRTVRASLVGARNGVRNVYADVRIAAASLAGRPGAREIALVTLENGDAEDDLEATVSAVRKAKARLFVLAREAFLSDSYWASHYAKPGPKGTTWTGGDAAFPEIPWGWLFQVSNGNEAAASGYALYGLTRLAAASEGKVFLVSEATTGGHACATLGICQFCTGDHVPQGESYQSARLKPLAPLAEARETVYAAAARDPFYRAVHAAWKKASDAGLVRSRPSLDLAGGTAKPDRRSGGAWAPLVGNGLAFTSLAGRAGKALEACERIRGELDADLGKARDDEGSARWRAVAEHVRLMLYLTRVNLVEYVGWCQETGPVVTGKKPFDVAPPEALPFAEGQRYIGLSYANWSLCHGVRPFREMHLPGGAALRSAIDDLEPVYGAYMTRYASTPFAVAGHRSAIAHFLPTIQGKPLPPPEKKAGGSTGEEPTTTTERPARDAGGGAETGPTTSGG